MAAQRLFSPSLSTLFAFRRTGSALGLAGFFLSVAISLPGCTSDSDEGSAAGGNSGEGGGSSEASPAPEFRRLRGESVNDDVVVEGTNERLDPRDPNGVNFVDFVDSANELRKQISGAGGNASYRIGDAVQPDSGLGNGSVDAGDALDAGNSVPDAGTP